MVKELTSEEANAVLKWTLEDEKAIEEFAKFFFPHHITDATPKFHTEIYDMLLDTTHPRVCIAAPRNFSKSTIVSFIYVLWQALYKKSKFILIISDTYTQSKLFLDAIKKELEDNDALKQIYGDMKGEQWSEGEVELSNGVKLMCKGAGMKVRGLKYRETRPDLVILDDLENLELVQSKDRRDKILRWFSAEIMPALDIRGRIIYVGTIMHYDSLLNKVLRDDSWERKIYQAIENKKSIWPERWSLEALEKLKTEYRKRGQLDLFFSEYMNDPITSENAEFKMEWFKYYDLNDIDTGRMNIFMTVDPAISQKEHADYTAIVTTGIDKKNNMYILDIVRERLTPTNLIIRLFALYKRWKPMRIGIESTAYQKALIYFTQDEMKRRNEWLPIEELKSDTDKERRIRGLIPRYNTGTVFHQNTHTILEEELLRFPKGEHDDVADALAYQLELNYPYTKGEPAKRVDIVNKDPYFGKKVVRKTGYLDL